MVFNKRNYSPIWLWRCIALYFCISVYSPAFGQIVCPINSSVEPLETKDYSTQFKVDQLSKSYTKSWSIIEMSSDTVASITLAGMKISHTLQFKNLSLGIPKGAKITGLKLTITGKSEGAGYIKDNTITLSHASKISDNYAGKGYSNKRVWAKNSTTDSWHYGWNDETWGQTWTSDDLNSDDFAVNIQIRNILNAAIIGLIEDLRLEVTYTELPTFCESSCPVFYVDQSPTIDSYKWHLPEGIVYTSKNDLAYIIDLHPTDQALPGVYTLCVDAINSDTIVDHCCREIRYVKCTGGVVGDFVWEDLNQNGVQDPTEKGIADISISLFSASNVQIATTTTDANGAYSFTEVPNGKYYIKLNNIGNYTLVSSFVGDKEFDSNITEANGPGTSNTFTVDYGENVQNIDAGLVSLTQISGLTWEDENGDGLRDANEALLPGVIVYLKDVSGTILSQTSTSTDGSYLFQNIIAGSYYVAFVFDNQLYTATLQNLPNSTLNSDVNISFETAIFLADPSGISNLDAGVYKQTFIGDQVWEDLNCNGIFDSIDLPFGEVKLLLTNQSGETIDSTVTNDEGIYLFQNIRPGIYTLKVKDQPDYTATTKDQSILNDDNGELTSDAFTLSSGDTLTTIDLGLIEYRSNICGVVWFDEQYDGIRQDQELLIEGVTVQLLNQQHIVLETTTTSILGEYCFTDILPDKYIVKFTIENFQIASPYHIGAAEIDSDIQTLEGTTATIVLKSGKNEENIDGGLANKAILGDFVWLDLNENGLQDIGEDGVQGTLIYLFDENSNLIDTATTDADGYYLFENILPNTYYIQVLFGPDYKQTLSVNGNESINSDFDNSNGLNTTSLFTLSTNQINLDIDLGLAPNLGSICGEIWLDTNSDGIRLAPEVNAQKQMLIEVLDENGEVAAISLSTVEGKYCISGIVPGNYKLKATVPTYYQFAPQDQGSDDTVDCDFNTLGLTNTITVAYGTKIEHVDVGLTLKSVIGDFVWIDENFNGLQDANEPGIPNVTVELFDLSNTLIEKVTTNNSGFYQFPEVIQGDYYIQFTPPANFIFTLPNASPTKGSAADAMGKTATFNVKPYEDNLDIDAGLVPAISSIQGLTWEDSNRNGIRESSEPFLPNIQVRLLNSNFIEISSQTTANDGKYQFVSLINGDYFIVFESITLQDFTLPLIGMEETNSDVTSIALLGATDKITLAVGEDKMHIDAGYAPKGGTIKGITWVDHIANGILDTLDSFLENVTINLYTTSDSTLIHSTVTDTLGNYGFYGVQNGSYFITFTPSEDCYTPTLPTVGIDTLLDSDITHLLFENSTDTMLLLDGNILCGVNGGFIGYSDVSGQIFKDVNENGLREAEDEGFDDVHVCLKDNDGTIIARDTSRLVNGISGSYSFDKVLPGKYTVQFTRPLYYLPSPKDQGSNDTIDSDAETIIGLNVTTDTITITSKSSIKQVDLGLFFSQEMQSMIAGEVWMEEEIDGIQQTTEPLIEGISIDLYHRDGTFVKTILTDNQGAYRFTSLSEGFYYLKASIPLDKTATYLNKGSDTTIDNDFYSRSEEIITPAFYLGVTSDSMQVDLGITDAISIGNFVWNDTNFNGLQDTDEEPYPDATVILLDGLGATLQKDTTDANGNYLFTRIPVGKYQLKLELPSGQFTTKQGQADETLNSNFDKNGLTPMYDFALGGQIDTIDAGVVSGGSIGDFLFIDYNGNGRQDASEPGISEFNVHLFEADGTLVATKITSGDMTINMGGFYLFENVRPGDYYLVFELQDDFKYTLPNMGSDELDSDVTSSITFGSTNYFVLLPSEIKTDMDCGIYLPSSLGDYVWEDINKNGIQELGENGIPGVEIALLKSNGQVISTTTTNSDGKYIFTGLNQGLYSIKFELLQDYTITLRDAGSDDETDSDPDPILGQTALISLAHGATFLGIDCGYYKTSTANDHYPGLPQEGSQKKTVDISSPYELIHPWPNPAIFETLLRVEEDGIYQLTVMHADGSIAASKEVTAVGGAVRLDISDYRAGKFYFLLSNKSKRYKGTLIRVY